MPIATRGTTVEASPSPTLALLSTAMLPSPTLSPSPTSTQAPTSVPTDVRATAIATLQHGIGSTREEIELALGPRRNRRDGVSYYLDGSIAIQFEAGLRVEISADFSDDPPASDAVNDLIERLRPEDARLSEAISDADGMLRRVYESEALEVEFGTDRRYVERVRLDPSSNEILGFRISLE